MNTALLLLASIASLVPFGNSLTVTAHVREEDGSPAAGVTVMGKTDKGGKVSGREPQYIPYEGCTDTNGNVSLKFENYSSHFNIQAYSDDHYMEYTNYVHVKSIQHADLSVTLTEHSKDISFTLRRKKNPTALYYRLPSFSLKLPSPSGEFGFDLQRRRVVGGVCAVAQQPVRGEVEGVQ